MTVSTSSDDDEEEVEELDVEQTECGEASKLALPAAVRWTASRVRATKTKTRGP